jgi:hypothetical protein
MLALALIGCSLLEPLRIECTSDMPCAEDDSSDTGGDTGGVVTPTRGFVGLVRGATRQVRVYAPDGRELARFPAPDTVEGPVDGTADGAVLAGDDGNLWQLDASGPVALPIGAALEAVHLDGATVWGFHAGGVMQVADRATTIPGPWGDVVAMGWSDGVGGWVVGWDDAARSSISAWAIGTDGASGANVSGFDSSAARARDVFTGPDGAAWGCSDAGAVYRLDAIGSDPRPVVVPNLSLRAVGTCGYDAGAGAFVLFDRTAGFVRVDADGGATIVVAPPGDGTFAYGNLL